MLSHQHQSSSPTTTESSSPNWPAYLYIDAHAASKAVCPHRAPRCPTSISDVRHLMMPNNPASAVSSSIGRHGAEGSCCPRRGPPPPCSAGPSIKEHRKPLPPASEVLGTPATAHTLPQAILTMRRPQPFQCPQR